ncbi:MAG: hypothetical protein EOP04_25565, partial [Proteobacteria bacterium]
MMRKHKVKVLAGIAAIFAILIITIFYPNTKTPESYHPITIERLEPTQKELNRWQVNKEATAKKLSAAPTEKIEVKETECKSVYTELVRQGGETFDRQFTDGEIDFSDN